MKLIAITGSIGSGKSVVAKIVETLGFPVYDCDTRAKALMESQPSVRDALSAMFGPEVYTFQGLNRTWLAERIFSDTKARNYVNRIVHQAVKDDIRHWAQTLGQTHRALFVETAIPTTSGIAAMVDEVWKVDTPVHIRRERVVTHRKMSAEDFNNRDNTQTAETANLPGVVINNSGTESLLAQIIGLIQSLGDE